MEDEPGMIPAVRHVDVPISLPQKKDPQQLVEEEKKDDTPFDEESGRKKEAQLKELDDIVAMLETSPSPTPARKVEPSSPPKLESVLKKPSVFIEEQSVSTRTSDAVNSAQKSVSMAPEPMLLLPDADAPSDDDTGNLYFSNNVSDTENGDLYSPPPLQVEPPPPLDLKKVHRSMGSMYTTGTSIDAYNRETEPEDETDADADGENTTLSDGPRADYSLSDGPRADDSLSDGPPEEVTTQVEIDAQAVDHRATPEYDAAKNCMVDAAACAGDICASVGNEISGPKGIVVTMADAVTDAVIGSDEGSAGSRRDEEEPSLRTEEDNSLRTEEDNSLRTEEDASLRTDEDRSLRTDDADPTLQDVASRGVSTHHTVPQDVQTDTMPSELPPRPANKSSAATAAAAAAIGMASVGISKRVSSGGYPSEEEGSQLLRAASPVTHASGPTTAYSTMTGTNSAPTTVYTSSSATTTTDYTKTPLALLAEHSVQRERDEASIQRERGELAGRPIQQDRGDEEDSVEISYVDPYLPRSDIIAAETGESTVVVAGESVVSEPDIVVAGESVVSEPDTESIPPPPRAQDIDSNDTNAILGAAAMGAALLGMGSGSFDGSGCSIAPPPPSNPPPPMDDVPMDERTSSPLPGTVKQIEAIESTSRDLPPPPPPPLPITGFWAPRGSAAMEDSTFSAKEEQQEASMQRALEPEMDGAEPSNSDETSEERADKYAIDEEAGTSKDSFRNMACCKRKNNRISYVLLATVLLLLLAIILISVAAGTNAFKPSASKAVITEPPAPSPVQIPISSPSPTPPLTPTTRAEAMGELLASRTYSAAALEDTGSPESKAFSWVAIGDPMQLDPVQDETRVLQRYSLATIYFSSEDSSDWRIDDGWMSDADECEWHGVVCDDGPDVSAIDLTNNRLTGGISPDLALLTTADTLVFNGNDMAGEIPSSLSEIPGLRVLGLKNNAFSGNLGAYDFSNMTELGVVDLRNNQFTGTIPEAIYDRELFYFDIALNDLTGTLSTRIGNMQALYRFSANGNELTGTIPAEIGNCESLELLHLSFNSLSGPIPDDTGRLTELTELNCENNRLTRVPDSLRSLRSMEVLRLGDNLFSASEFPNYVYDMPGLRELWLENSGLTGQLDRDIRKLTNIQSVRLHGNQLEGTIPPEIGAMTNATSLRLEGNAFTGNIPAEVGNMVQLEDLRLNDNFLAGPLPDSMGNLVDLEELYLDGNFLSGQIPDSMTNLEELETWSLHDNFFSGTLPENIGNMDSLVTFTAYLNGWNTSDRPGISGPIPTSIGQLDRLRVFAVFQNALSSTIPTEIGNCESLRALDLENNNLEGTVPEELSNLQELRTLELGGNPEIVGPLSGEICTGNTLETFRVDCELLCGCCTEACGAKDIVEL